MLQNFIEYKATYNDLYSILLYSIKFEKTLRPEEKKLIINYLTRMDGEFPEIKTLLSKIKKSSWDIAEREINTAVKNKVDVINILDPRYPEKLKEIYDPPFVIFVRGKIGNNFTSSQNSSENAPLLTIGIVGTRTASPNGKKIAGKLAQELTWNKINIVSGLAYGIDTAAHVGAANASAMMKAQHGLSFSPGIMVLGSGVLAVYPKQNIELSEHLLELGGVLMSEYGVFAEPQDFHFPARNRIISGLSSGVVIIEAKEMSGSLITARLALEQGREVFVVPGDIDNSNCSGSNKLIQQGAALITCAEDILEHFPQVQCSVGFPVRRSLGEGGSLRKAATAGKHAKPGTAEQQILNFIRTRNNCTLDDIVEHLAISPSVALACLNKMELEQMIFTHPGNIYSMDRFI